MVTRIVVWLLAMFFLTGCGSVRFKSTKTPPSQPAMTAQQPTWSSDAVIPGTSGTVVKTLQYGRFTVEVYADGSQEIKGGKFNPPKVMPVKSVHAHVMIINYTTNELTYYRRTSTGVYEPVQGFAVITPNPDSLPRDEVRGVVRRIDQSPSWCVTPQIRDALRRKEVPVIVEVRCYPYRHPQNAMGTAKFEISWNVQGFAHVRLHGTGGYAEGNFWDDTTLGCTRLLDDAMEELLRLLGPDAVKEGIEVIALRG